MEHPMIKTTAESMSHRHQGKDLPTDTASELKHVMMRVLSNLRVVIILQYTHVSNHHITLNLHKALCQFYLNKAGKT